MKKLLIFLLSLILCLGLSGCSLSNDSDNKKIEKTVDAVAAELGFTDEKQEKAYQMIGAEDGAGYGSYEIYIYDEGSEAYDDVTEDGYDIGMYTVKAIASNDGVVLVHSGADEPDQAIIDKFEDLEF